MAASLRPQEQEQSAEEKFDFFQQYFAMPEEARRKLVHDYKQKFKAFNNEIIVESAARILQSIGLSGEDFVSLQVGPLHPKDRWNLNDQLKAKLRPEDYQKKYIFFSIPTNNGEHSIATVIHANGSASIVDSLNNLIYIEEASNQLSRINIFSPRPWVGNGVNPANRSWGPDDIQQTDNWSCGVHSALNIIGIILNEELKNEKSSIAKLSHNNSKNPAVQALFNTRIFFGKRLPKRTPQELDDYLGILCLAYDQYSLEKEGKLNDPRLAVRKYKCLHLLVRGLTTDTLPQTISKQELITFQKAVADARAAADQAKEIVDSGGQASVKPIKIFIEEFLSRNPKSPFRSFLTDEKFFTSLPQALDNAEYNAAENRIRELFERTILMTSAVAEKKEGHDASLDLPREQNSPAALPGDLQSAKPKPTNTSFTPVSEESTPLLRPKTASELLNELDAALSGLHGDDIYTSGMSVYVEGNNEFKELMKDAEKNLIKLESLRISLQYAINVVNDRLNPQHIIDLKLNAEKYAIGSPNLGKKYVGALLALVGVVMLCLSVAGIPFSGGSSAAGIGIGGGLLAAGGAGLFYNGTQRKLAKKLSNLAETARIAALK